MNHLNIHKINLQQPSCKRKSQRINRHPVYVVIVVGVIIKEQVGL